MAERRSKRSDTDGRQARTRAESQTKSQAKTQQDAVDATPAEAVKDIDVGSFDAGFDPADDVDVPDPEQGLGDQAEGDAMPAQEEPVAEHGAGVAGDVLEEAGIEGPSTDHLSDADREKFGDGPATLDDTLGVEDLISQEHGFGGADGRNDASDTGGGAYPGSEEYEEGVAAAEEAIDAAGGMVGALSDKKQGQLQDLDAAMKAAQERGDNEAANKIADEAWNIANLGEGYDPPETIEGTGGQTYQFGEDGVQATDAQNAIAENASEEWQNASAHATGTAKGTTRGDALAQAMDEIASQDRPNESAAPAPESGSPPSTPETEDRSPDQGLEGPDMWTDFTDEYQDSKLDAIKGSDVDPNPNDDSFGQSTDMEIDTDHEQFVAEYGPDASPEEAGMERPIDTTPDEEFFDVD